MLISNMNNKIEILAKTYEKNENGIEEAKVNSLFRIWSDARKLQSVLDTQTESIKVFEKMSFRIRSRVLPEQIMVSYRNNVYEVIEVDDNREGEMTLYGVRRYGA